jgi:hypothetical protein
MVQKIQLTNSSFLKSLPFGHMTTASGHIINLLDPDPTEISIFDISSALSKMCRFGGNINCFYSVAQHSCLVAWLAGPELAKIAMMHDAAEAYCGDVIRPLKIMLGSKYSVIEDRILRAVFKSLYLNYDKYPLIKEFDDLALDLEEQALFYNNTLFQKDIQFKSSVFCKYKPDKWNWEPRFAQKAFLETWMYLLKNPIIK